MINNHYGLIENKRDIESNNHYAHKEYRREKL